MPDAPKPERFLEPIYVNETMVLNAAAYLFSGAPTDTTHTDVQERQRGTAVRAGLPFLDAVIGLSGEARNISRSQEQSARKFTVGGLHMNVVDSLAKKDMIKDVTSISDNVLQEAGILDKYIHAHVALQPSDYWATLQILKTMSPLIIQLLKDYGSSLLPKMNFSRQAWADLLPRLDVYAGTVNSIVDSLIEDYLRSGMVEMVMWLDGRTQLGVIDLNSAGYDARALSASLVGGRYHVYGKITAKAKTGEKLSLLQRTTLYQIQALFYRLKAFTNALPKNQDDKEEAKSLEDVEQSIAEVTRKLDLLLRIEMKGPALRLAGMSVCV